MAKIAAPAAAAAEDQKPAKGGKSGWIVGAVICLLALGSGFALPFFLHLGNTGAGAAEPEAQPANGPKEAKEAQVPFDSVVVNVASGTYSRYLRAKIVLVVDEKDEKQVKELIEKKKSYLQDWVNSYLSDRTLDELHGSAAKNRVRREIRDQFNAMLFSDGSEKIKNLLMPEFNFQ
jgi:flagellar basal body-associated protein FliL